MTTELGILARLKDEASRPLSTVYDQVRDLEYVIETFNGDFEVSAIGVGFDAVIEYLDRLEDTQQVEIEIATDSHSLHEARE